MTTPTDTQPVAETIKLSLSDTCDACGHSEDTSPRGVKSYSAISQAFVRVTFPNGHVLDFCGHCYSVNELTLATHGVTVHDQRTDINRSAGYSA